MAKRRNRLRLTVLIDRECSLVEVGHEVLLIVEDGGMEDDFFNLFLEDESPAVAGFGSLPRSLIYGLPSTLRRRLGWLGSLRCGLRSLSLWITSSWFGWWSLSRRRLGRWSLGGRWN